MEIIDLDYSRLTSSNYQLMVETFNQYIHNFFFFFSLVANIKTLKKTFISFMILYYDRFLFYNILHSDVNFFFIFLKITIDLNISSNISLI